tara:strand:- start:290 stop:1042 length:753 start_codon:yes stop_codon:yes gene_type:complete
MSRFITTRNADGTSGGGSGGGGGLGETQVKDLIQNNSKWTCVIHCYPWTCDYGSVMCIDLPWKCYDGFDIEFNALKHRNCCYENTYCFMPMYNDLCLCDSMQNWMCHTCSNCFARGSWESSGSCHTMKTTQCCCTSGYADGFVGYGIKLVMCKDSSRNCNSPTMTQKTSSMRYTMCYWNHCDNYGCANAQWGNGCLHCLESAGGGWPGWCCNVDSTWTGIMLKNNCGYMEPANTMSFWSVYGHRNPNITG